VSETNWELLWEQARKMLDFAYCPYSNFPVGAAAFTTDGTLVTGCNVENASYGLGLCAECGLVSDLASKGGGKLAALVVVASDGQPVAPCGRCRQLLWEHGGRTLQIMTTAGPIPFETLLPDAFGPEDLNTRSTS
jgi:cytidine deaminase